VLSPNAVEKPSDGGVLVDGEIDVVCEVRKSNLPGAEEIAEETVTVQLLDAEGAQVDVVSAAPGENPGEYVAELIVAKVTENGRLSILCAAGDRSIPPLTGVDRVDTFIDHGPAITVMSPEDGEPFALTGGVPFEFSVEPDPVGESDDEAGVEHVTLEVGGVNIELEDHGVGANELSVDLSDQELFGVPPSGTVPITIRAINRREPRAVERLVSYAIQVDSEGPRIEIESPAYGAVVGGRQVQLKFSVRDELSGVDPNSVVVELNGESHRYEVGGPWSKVNDDFVFLFDSTQAGKGSEVEATINISATDAVGNRAEGASLSLHLDNVPPTVELDPPNVREWHRTSTGAIECSMSFDPVGDAPPNDLSTIARIDFFRALVWDETNETDDQHFTYAADTDQESVYVYLQADPSVPLLVDTNKDGACDELAVDDAGVTFRQLRALEQTGSSWFNDTDQASPPNGSEMGCTYISTPNPPPFLCTEHSDLRRVIAHGKEGRPPVIYVDGKRESGYACTGEEWEFASNAGVEEGWLCFAARAVDNVGNIGISPPLRLCYDDPQTAFTPSCINGADPPTCADDCSPPPRFDNLIIRGPT
jgi:hypothetical protein